MSSIFNKIQWTEGMLLKPQHFQQQDRYHEHALSAQTRLLKRFYWGFYELNLDQEALEEGYIALNKAQGYFRDGTFFDIPRLSKAPEALKLKADLENTPVFLTIEKEIESSYQRKVEPINERYSLTPIKVSNSEEEIIELAELRVKKLHLNLIQTAQAPENLSALAVIKSYQLNAEGKITFDERYIPALINIQGNQKLMQRIKTLVAMLYELVSGTRLIPRQADYNSYIQFQYSATLKEAFHTLSHLLNTEPTHPESLYQVLLKLRVQLSVIHQVPDSTKLPIYQQDDLASCINGLIDFIQATLKLNPCGGAIEIMLKENQYGYWLSSLIDKKLLEKSLVLTIKTALDKALAAEQVPKHLKIGTQKNIYTLVKQALPGIVLVHLKSPPSVILLNEQQLAFSLEKGSKPYSELLEELNIALHGTHSLGKLTPQLWAIDS